MMVVSHQNMYEWADIMCKYFYVQVVGFLKKINYISVHGMNNVKIINT
jgi:hypothetical protein